MTWQYFSKWRKKWVDFKSPPTPGELAALKKYHYQVRQLSPFQILNEFNGGFHAWNNKPPRVSK